MQTLAQLVWLINTLMAFSAVLFFVNTRAMALELDADRHALKIISKTAMLLGLEAMKNSNKDRAAYYELKIDALNGKWRPWFR